MATLTVGTIKAQLGWTYEDDGTLAETSNQGSVSFSSTQSNGTGANQSDKIYFIATTLAASGSTTYNLGSLTDVFGSALDFERVKVIYLKNKTTTGTNGVISVGGAASNQFVNWVGNTDDLVNVRPGGVLLLAAQDATAYSVSTGVNLKLLNTSGSTTVSYDLVVIGASA